MPYISIECYDIEEAEDILVKALINDLYKENWFYEYERGISKNCPKRTNTSSSYELKIELFDNPYHFIVEIKEDSSFTLVK